MHAALSTACTAAFGCTRHLLRHLPEWLMQPWQSTESSVCMSKSFGLQGEVNCSLHAWLLLLTVHLQGFDGRRVDSGLHACRTRMKEP